MNTILKELIDKLVDWREEYAGILELEECVEGDTIEVRRIIAQFAVNQDLVQLAEEIDMMDTILREHFYSVTQLIELKLGEMA